MDTTFKDTAGKEAKLEKKGREKYNRGSNPPRDGLEVVNIRARRVWVEGKMKFQKG